MKMPKPPIEFLVDSFQYQEITGRNNWDEPIYSEPVTINNCRIDKGATFTQTVSGKQLLYNAVIFCYAGLTNPLPKFQPEGLITFDEQEHKIIRTIPITEAYSTELYAYEIEVV